MCIIVIFSNPRVGILVRMKETVQLHLQKLSSRVYLTCDMWHVTWCTIDRYLCLTAHFIDDDRKFSQNLNFRHSPPPTAHRHILRLFYLLRGWGIALHWIMQVIWIACNCGNLDQQGALLCSLCFWYIKSYCSG